MSEAESWLAAAPKLANGKVDVRLLIEEGRRRRYCICPKPLRQLISFEGYTCQWCGQRETSLSHAFWYAEDTEPRVIVCPVCEMPSANRNDIREGYCGNCHEWTTPRPDGPLWPREA